MYLRKGGPSGFVYQFNGNKANIREYSLFHSAFGIQMPLLRIIG